MTSVASDLSAALTRNPELTLETYVRDEFSHIYRPFAVITVDGRTMSNRPNSLPPGLLPLDADAPAARRVSERGRPAGWSARRPATRPILADHRPVPPPDRDRPPDAWRGGRPERGDRGGPPEPGDGQGPRGGGPGGPARGSASAPITVAGKTLGFVAIPINPPPVFVALRELGPTLTWVGLILLAIGAASAALLIFGPAHRRLRTLEQAARALGEGRTDVRAVEAGGDEVSALAHAFNTMADDLGTRAAALAASDKARRQLLADVSHELMTPLAAIRGYTETLAMPELELDQPTRGRYLDIVGDETQKLESLIGDLLDLARLEGGGGTLTLEDVPIRELFSRVADRHGPSIRERHVALEVDVTAARPDGARRRATPGTGAAESRRQRARHTPEGGQALARRQDDGGWDEHHGSRHRPGHPGRAPAAYFREVLQSRFSPKRHQAVWQRPRAVDRSGDCRTPRWNRDRDERSGGGSDLRDHDSRRQYPETDPQSSD